MTTILRTFAIAMVLILAGGMLPDHVATAQPGHAGPSDRNERMLQARHHQLSQAWQRAWDQTRQTQDPQVRALLEQARERLNKAQELITSLSSGTSEDARVTAQAAGHLDVAQTLIERSLGMSRRTGGVTGSSAARRPVQESLRGAELMLDRMRRQGAIPLQARQVEGLIVQARHAEAAGNHELAAQLAERAQDRSRMIWREEMRREMASHRAEMLDTVVEPMVERALRLAQESGDERMSGIAERARENLRLARQLDPDTQADARARLLEAAMRESAQVMRGLDKEGFNRHRAEQAITEAEAALRRASEAVSDDEGSTLLEQGVQLMTQARSRMEAGDPIAAERLAAQARRNARQVLEQSLGSLDSESVAEAIAQTDRLIEQAQSRSSMPTASEQFLHTARERQAAAKQLLASGELRQALAETRIAARLAERARVIEN